MAPPALTVYDLGVNPLAVTPDDVRAAHALIEPHVRWTPLLRANAETPSTWLKLELLQHAGSFKTRGAFHQLLARKVPPAGVTAASGGNHGVAVALAAHRLGHRARIFVPEISSSVKVDAIRSHGAEIVIGGARYADAQAACDAYAHESGALLIHPYDAVPTVAGAGTIALEWERDLERRGEPPIDTVLASVGGGGLLAGLAAYFQKRVRLVGVEPRGSCCLHAALEAGAPVDVAVESIAADSLGAKRVGELPLQILRAIDVTSVLVEDDDIARAQRELLRDYRLLVEPGGAAAWAALRSGRWVPRPNERVGVLVCGSNVDPKTLD